MSKAVEALRVHDYPYLVSDPVSYLVKTGRLALKMPLWKAVDFLGVEKYIEDMIVYAVVKEKYPPPELGEKADVSKLIVSFHAALLVLASLPQWYSKRFALVIAKSSGEKLSRLGDRELALVARLMGIDVEIHDRNPLRIPYRSYRGRFISAEYNFSLHFIDYTKWTRRLSGDPRWKITNQLLIASRVFVDRDQLVRLVEEAISKRIEELVDRYSGSIPQSGQLPHPLDIVKNRVSEVLEKEAPPPKPFAEGARSVYRGPLVLEAFPPCMARILEEARRGANLSHHQRFAIATFMISLGAGEDDVVDVFRNVPDFNEKKTRYQVQHLMGARGSGKKYLPYSCDKMRTLNLCVADCGTRTPMQKYFQNLRDKRSYRKEGGVGVGGPSQRARVGSQDKQ